MSTSAQATGMKALSIKVIGIGGAGANCIEQLMSARTAATSFTVVHTNASLLEKARCPEKMLLGAKRLRGLGVAGDPDLGWAVAEEESEKLRALCSRADLLLIAAGLGGGTATGAAPVLARLAKEGGALVLGVV